MAMNFHNIKYRSGYSGPTRNVGLLQSDNWDDFGFKSTFSLILYNDQGIELKIGDLKIGFRGQTEGWTEEAIPQEFTHLESNFFSLGQDADYYKKLVNLCPGPLALEILTALGDVAYDSVKREIAEKERVFGTSLLRVTNRTTIDNQYAKIIKGEAPLTEYHFCFERKGSDTFSQLGLEFIVNPDSKPSSNLHVLIGRNGIGKTTILNAMVDSLFTGENKQPDLGYFYKSHIFSSKARLDDQYFAGIVSVSFSAFDPFEPPPDQSDSSAGMRYKYIGLKSRIEEEERPAWGLKDKPKLCKDLALSLSSCLSLQAKKERWITAIKKLESDHNFEEMNLSQLIDHYEKDPSEQKTSFIETSSRFLNRMSSGHAIVLLTITQLIETVEEKTLVLIDEPESHLHPPLLSAFTRALSDLLTNRNAVAIIATHSPVVLQEVPKSCVSIINRSRLVATVDRPDIETFAENVGTLTRHVFGLEVSKSGFHDLLEKSVQGGKSYEEIDAEYGGEIGLEGRALLRAMTTARDKAKGEQI